MRINTKNNSFIFTIIVMILFTLYKNFPDKIQIFMPLFLAIYFVFNIGILIYKNVYWEEIFRVVTLFISSLIIFITYYNSAFNFDSSFMKIALLTIGWAFPCLAYTGVVSWKRRGNKDKYKQNLFLLAYCIFLAVFCTIIVIIK